MEQQIEQLLGAVDPDSIDDITSVYYEIGDLIEANDWDFRETMLMLIGMLTHGDRPSSVLETISILLEHFSDDLLDDSEMLLQICDAVKVCLASPIPGLRSSASALLAAIAASAWPLDEPAPQETPDVDGLLVQPLLQAAAQLQESNYGVTVLPDGTVSEAEVHTPPAAMGALVAIQMLMEQDMPSWCVHALLAPGVLAALQHMCVPLPQDAASAPLQYTDILASQQVTCRARASLVRYAASTPGTRLQLGDTAAAAPGAEGAAASATPIDAAWLKDPHLCTAGTSASAGNWHGTGQSRFARTAPQLAAQVLGGIMQYAVEDSPQWAQLQVGFAKELLHLSLSQWLFSDATELVAVRRRVAAASILGYVAVGLEYASEAAHHSTGKRLTQPSATYGAGGLLSLALPRITRLCFPAFEPSFPVRSASLWALSHVLGLLHDTLLEHAFPAAEDEDGPDALPESLQALRQGDALRRRTAYLPAMDVEGAVWVHGAPAPLPGLSRTADPGALDGEAGASTQVLAGLPPPPAWLMPCLFTFPPEAPFSALHAAAQSPQGTAPSGAAAPNAGAQSPPPVPHTEAVAAAATASMASDSEHSDSEEEDGDMPPAAETPLQAAAGAAAPAPVKGGHPQDPHGSPAARGLCAAVLNGASADMHTQPWDEYVRSWSKRPGPALLRELGVLCSDTDLVALGVIVPPGAEGAAQGASQWDFDIKTDSALAGAGSAESSLQAQLLAALLVNVQPGCPTAWTEHMFDTVSVAHFVLRIAPFRLRIAAAARLFQVSIPRFSDSLLQLQKTRRGSLPLQWAAWLGWHTAHGQGGMRHCNAAEEPLGDAIAQLLEEEADGDWPSDDSDDGDEGGAGGAQNALALRWVRRQRAVDVALRASSSLSSGDTAGLTRMRRVLLLQGRWLTRSLWEDCSPVRAFTLHSLVASVTSNITGSTALEGSLRCLPGATVSVLRRLVPVWRDMVSPLSDAAATSPEAFKLLGCMFTTAPGADSAKGAAAALLGAASSGAVGRPAPSAGALRFVLTTIANTVQSTSEVPLDIAADILQLCVLSAEWAFVCLCSSPLQGSSSPEQLQPHPEGGPMPAPAAALKTMSEQQREQYTQQLQAMQDKAFLRRCLVGSGWLLPRGVAAHVALAALDIMSFVVDSIKEHLSDIMAEHRLAWRVFRVLLLGMSVFETPGSSAVLHGSVGPVVNAWLGARGEKGGSAPAAAAAAGGAAAATSASSLGGMLSACPDLGCSLAQVGSLLSRLHGTGLSLHGSPLVPADASPEAGFGGIPPEEDMQWGDEAAEARLQEAEDDPLVQMQAHMHGATAGRAMQCGWADVDGSAADDSGSALAQARPGFFSLCYGGIQSSALAVFGNLIKHSAECFAPSVLQEEAAEHTQNTLKAIAAGVMPRMQKDGPIPPLALLFVARSVRRATALVTGDISHLKPWGAAAAAGASSFGEHFALPEACEAPPVTAVALLMQLGGVMPHTLLPQSAALPVPWPVMDPLSGAAQWAEAPHKMQSTPPKEDAVPLVQALSRDLASRAARTSAIMQRSLQLQRLVGETPLHVNVMFAASMLAARLGPLLGPLADPSSLPVTQADGAFPMRNLWHSMKDVLRLCHPKVAFAKVEGGEGGGALAPHQQHMHAILTAATSPGGGDASSVLQAAAPSPSGGQGDWAAPGSTEWLQDTALTFLEAQHDNPDADPALLQVAQAMAEHGPGVLAPEQLQHIMSAVVGGGPVNLPPQAVAAPSTPADIDAAVAKPSSNWVKRFAKGSLASGVENAVQAVGAIVARRLAAGRPAGIQGSAFESWCTAVRCSPFMDAMDERFDALMPLLAAVQAAPALACPAAVLLAPADTPPHQLIEGWPEPGAGEPALPNGWATVPLGGAQSGETPLSVTVDATAFVCFMGAAVSGQLQYKPPSAADVGVRSTALLPANKVQRLQAAVRGAMAAVRSAAVQRVTAGLADSGAPGVQLVGAAGMLAPAQRQALLGAVCGAVFDACLAAVPLSFTKLFMPVLQAGSGSAAPPSADAQAPPAAGGAASAE